MSVEDGYRIANTLGANVNRHEHGDDGIVFFLEDGRIMKTVNLLEAAVALAIKKHQQVSPHPAVPVIHDVFQYQTSIAGVGYVYFRDDVADYQVPEVLRDDWRMVLRFVNQGWKAERASTLVEAKDKWRPHGHHLETLVSGLQWVKAQTGCKVSDIRPSHVGVTAGGAVGIRNFSRGEVPAHILDAVRSVDEVKFRSKH